MITATRGRHEGTLMRRINRRAVLGCAAILLVSGPAYAGKFEEFSAEADEGSVALTRYAADRAEKRPGVIVLHGGRGIELKPRAYERYADALNAAGIDVYFARYLTATDIQALDPKTSTGRSREVYETERIAALAVMYGGMPDAMVPEVKHLPPLVELHGDADRNVPLAKGQELVKLAKAVGSQAEQVTYPGREHGFDFSDTDPMTADAIARITRFFQSELR
jgi:carboxymethylenebutenolidase